MSAALARPQLSKDALAIAKIKRFMIGPPLDAFFKVYRGWVPKAVAPETHPKSLINHNSVPPAKRRAWQHAAIRCVSRPAKICRGLSSTHATKAQGGRSFRTYVRKKSSGGWRISKAQVRRSLCNHGDYTPFDLSALPANIMAGEIAFGPWRQCNGARLRSNATIRPTLNMGVRPARRELHRPSAAA